MKHKDYDMFSDMTDVINESIEAVNVARVLLNLDTFRCDFDRYCCVGHIYLNNQVHLSIGIDEDTQKPAIDFPFHQFHQSNKNLIKLLKNRVSQQNKFKFGNVYIYLENVEDIIPFIFLIV